MTNREISIDFGSARTKVAYLPEGQSVPELVELGMEVRPVLPSVFLVPKPGGGAIAVGDDAVQLADQDPDGIVVGIKTDIHRPGKVRLGPGRLAKSRVELASELFAYVRRRCMAEVFHRESLTACVLTVPVCFNEVQREALVCAAKQAGFATVRLVEEPVAAAQAWLSSPSGERIGDHVIVVDVGGGTTDIAALKRCKGRFQTLAELPHAGFELGGNSIDAALVERLCPRATGLGGWQVKMRKVKELLPTSGRSELRVSLGGECVVVTREALEQASQQLVTDCGRAVRHYLDGFHNATGDKICPILLAGGGARLAGLKQELEEIAPGRILVWNDSDFAVVKGALLGAFHGAVSGGDACSPGRSTQRAPSFVFTQPPLPNQSPEPKRLPVELADTLVADADSTPSTAACGCCGRPLPQSMRVLPPEGRVWTGSLAPHAASGVCPKCHQARCARGEERLWPFSFARVPAGSYWIGSPENEPDRKNDEIRHSITLTRDFEIQTTPVTQAQYLIVAKLNPSHFKGPERPVEQVTWFQAVAYCNELSRIRGVEPAYGIEGNTVNWIRGSSGFRLPTEAEWEVACRAGAAGPGYGPRGDVAWYNANSGKQTHPVGKKKPNAWGLFDTLGNVWEWCWDWYGDYQTTAQEDPLGVPSGTYRVYRGGGWGNSASVVRAASRFGSSPSAGFGSLGFRLCRTLNGGC